MLKCTEDSVIVSSTGPVSGGVRPVGSKSHTNRALVCAALADGVSRLRHASDAEDVEAMVGGLAALGVAVERTGGDLVVTGSGGQLPALTAEINVGPAGTAMRFLAALATLGYGEYSLDGNARMRARPIGELVGALQQLGAGIGYAEERGYPPLQILARGLLGGAVTLDRPASSQFISAVLMVAPYATDDVLLAVTGDLPSRPYVDLTIGLMRDFGVEVLASDENRFVIASGQRYRGCEVAIEPDASAATYFWGAAAITGGRVLTEGVRRSHLQGDIGFVDVLGAMGCVVEETGDGLAVQGPARLRGIEVDLNKMPDTVQTLAVVALFAEGPTTIRNVANLRVKETDRLAALEAELGKLGARVATGDDWIEITPPATLTPARIADYDDHRMVMSFALAGLRGCEVSLSNPQCVAKSYPRFFVDLGGLISTAD